MPMSRTPYWRVYVEGEDVTQEVSRRLTQIRIEERATEVSDALTLELADDGKLPMPTEGASITVELGYEDGKKRDPSDFEVDQVAHEAPPPRITFSATAAPFTTSAREPRERSHDDTTLGELLEKIAGEHGYEAVIHPPELGETRLWHVDQGGESDLALLHELAQKFGAQFRPAENSKWVIFGPSDMPEPAAVIEPHHVTEWRAQRKTREVLGSVRARYQAIDLARRIPVTAGDGEPTKLLDRVFVDEPTAKAHAEGRLANARREARELRLEMPGRPDLTVLSVIEVNGLGPEVDGLWRIREHVHQLNSSGYRSTIECEGV